MSGDDNTAEIEDTQFNAGELDPQNPAEQDAANDYDKQVGSDEHEQAVADAREGAGFDDPPTTEP